MFIQITLLTNICLTTFVIHKNDVDDNDDDDEQEEQEEEEQEEGANNCFENFDADFLDVKFHLHIS